MERLGIKAEGRLPIEATEERKTLATVREIEHWLLEKGADREAFVLGVGGGITTDITGFAASVYKRGYGSDSFRPPFFRRSMRRSAARTA